MQAPSFDTWTTLFLVVSAIGTFLSVLLFTDKNGRKNNWPIALITLGFSLILIQYVLIWTRYRTIYPYAYFFDDVWYFLFGPLFYIYILKFYTKEYKSNLIHFILPLFIAILSVIYYIKTKGYSAYDTVRDEILFKIYWPIRSPWVGIAVLICYIIITLDFIKIYNPPKKSQATQLRDRWVRFLILLFSTFVVAYISYYVLVKFSFFNPLWDYAISFTMAIGIYGVGYMAYTEPKIFNGELFTNLFQPSKKDKSELSPDTKNEFYSKLITYMEDSKPHLNSDLRLIDIATAIGLPIHIVSQLINEKANTNFNQFINAYRIKEASKLLKKSTYTSISSMYYDLGFNSRTTFYNTFKDKYGCTPLQYQESHKGKTLS